MYFELFQKIGATYQHFLINTRQDFCKHITGELKSIIIEETIKIGKLFSNIEDMLQCPIKNGTILKVENFYPPLSKSYVFINGDYLGKGSFEIINNNKFLRIATVELYASLKFVAEKNLKKV